MDGDLEPKETVILVHGTWAAPVDSVHQWYQRREDGDAQQSFVAKLDAALEHHGSSARCWAHQNQLRQFHWSGRNSWIDRAHAAIELASAVRTLQSDGWKCHIVAHSHGGNVAIEAVFPAWRSLPPEWRGRVVTLGTPFLDTVSVPKMRRERMEKFFSFAAWCMTLILLGVLVVGGIIVAEHVLDDSLSTPVGEIRRLHIYYLVLGFFVAIMLYAMWDGYRRLRSHAVTWKRFWQQQSLLPPCLLAINSRADEAWQLLHHVRSARNPFDPGVGLLQFLVQTGKRLKLRSDDANKALDLPQYHLLTWRDKIQVWAFWSALLYPIPLSVAVFFLDRAGLVEAGPDFNLLTMAVLWVTFSAIFLVVFLMSTISSGSTKLHNAGLPARWIYRSISILAALPSAAVTFLVRSRVWSVVQEAACGLEGYGFTLPLVEVAPGFAPASFYRHEVLSSNVETRALKGRDIWLGQHFGEVTSTFSNLVVTASDVEALLRLVATDLSLVHAAYYRDDETIDRIARWIAGKG